MLLQFTLIRRFKTKQNIRLWVSSSVPSGLGFYSLLLCRRSLPPSCSLEQATKTLKNKSSPHCAFVFHGCITSSDMKCLLYDMFRWHRFCRSIDVIFYCFREKSLASVTKVPAVACSWLLFWTLHCREIKIIVNVWTVCWDRNFKGPLKKNGC